MTNQKLPNPNRGLQRKIAKAVETLDGVENALKRLYADLKTTDTRIARTEDAGIIRATPYWRDKKYLVLVYPMTAGQRRRQYVGKDPKRIAKAIKAIDRYADWQALLAERADINRQIEEILTRVNWLANTLPPR